jgi:predicted nucleic acid-binding Zn ribbon protein
MINMQRAVQMLEGNDFSHFYPCKVCGKIIFDRGKRRAYCSDKCRKMNLERRKEASPTKNLLGYMDATRDVAWKNGFGYLSGEDLMKDAMAGFIPGHYRASPRSPFYYSNDVLWEFLRSDRGFTYHENYNPAAMFTNNRCNRCNKGVKNPERFRIHEIGCQRKNPAVNERFFLC